MAQASDGFDDPSEQDARAPDMVDGGSSGGSNGGNNGGSNDGSDGTTPEEPTRDDEDMPSQTDLGDAGRFEPGGCAVGSSGCQCTTGGGCDPGLSCRSGVCANDAPCVAGSAGCTCSDDGTCDADLSCEDDLCVSSISGGNCQQAPSSSGALAASGTEISFDSADVDVEHKRDVDEFEDGCIRTLEFAFRSGSGCLLSVSAADVLNQQDELLVTAIAFSADSQCPNFPDASEGLYAGSGDAISGSWVSMAPVLVPERNVAMACFEATFQVTLQGTIETDDGRTLTLEGTALQLTGPVLSVAAEGRCPVECVLDSHCPGSLSCVDEVCSDVCTNDSECRTGNICDASGSCLPGCRDDDGCRDDETCDSGSCVPEEDCSAASCEPECSIDGDCNVGELCNSGSCVPGCRDDDGCPGDNSCVAGTCVENAGSGQSYSRCTNDAPTTTCPQGEVCLQSEDGSAVCAQSCETTSECPPAPSGSAVPQCVLACLLRCSSDESCPEGMICDDVSSCVWPLEP